MRRTRLLILFPVALIIVLICKICPFIAEYVFARGIYRLLSIPMGIITAIFPFSLAEVIIVAIPLIFLAVVALFIINLCKNKGAIKRYLAGCAINVMVFFSVVLFVFVITCGTNYYRYDFEEFCEFKTEEYSVEELIKLCEYLKEKVETEKSGLLDSVDENGALIIGDSFSKTVSQCKDAMSDLAEEYSVLRYSTGTAKEVYFSRYMSYGRIVGIFIPFTMEANVNTDVPDYNRPADICHELAHMRGFMKEDEANYISYLACTKSENQILRYSGYMLAFVHATNALYDYDRDAYFKIMGELSREVMADFDCESKYWDELEESGTAEVVGDIWTSVNDGYLKVNGQDDGVNSYGRMVDLLLAEFLYRNGN